MTEGQVEESVVVSVEELTEGGSKTSKTASVAVEHQRRRGDVTGTRLL